MNILYTILTSSLLTGVVTWFLTKGKVKDERNKLRAEAEGAMLENIKRYSDVVKTFVEPLEREIEELKIKIKEIQNENNDYRDRAKVLEFFYCKNIECKNRCKIEK